MINHKVELNKSNHLVYPYPRLESLSCESFAVLGNLELHDMFQTNPDVPEFYCLVQLGPKTLYSHVKFWKTMCNIACTCSVGRRIDDVSRNVGVVDQLHECWLCTSSRA